MYVNLFNLPNIVPILKEGKRETLVHSYSEKNFIHLIIAGHKKGTSCSPSADHKLPKFKEQKPTVERSIIKKPNW